MFASCTCLSSEHEIDTSSSFKRRLACGGSTLLYCHAGIIKIWDASYIHVNSSDCRFWHDLSLPKVQCPQSEARRIISASCNGQVQCDTQPFINCEENYNALDILYTCQKAKNVISCGKDSIQHLQCGPGKGVLSILSAHYGGQDNHACNENRLANRQLSNTQCTLNGTTAMISQRCEGKTQCEVNMNTLRDPCPGINKYLDTSYTCVQAKSMVVCEHNTMFIDCGQDVIKILSGNYGRTDQTTCIAGRPKNQIVKTDCFLPKAFTDIANRCDQQTQCSVGASNSVFSDPCYGTFKYLEVSFTCLPAERSITCEHSVTTISCDGVIRILNANYGRRDRHICSVGRPASQASNVNCNSPSAMATVLKMCDGKMTCDLHSNNAFFGEPCHGTYKYLDVSYTCVPFRT